MGVHAQFEIGAALVLRLTDKPPESADESRRHHRYEHSIGSLHLARRDYCVFAGVRNLARVETLRTAVQSEGLPVEVIGKLIRGTRRAIGGTQRPGENGGRLSFRTPILRKASHWVCLRSAALA